MVRHQQHSLYTGQYRGGGHSGKPAPQVVKESATAPYNFIPQSIVLPLDSNRLSKERYSGEIICSLYALSPLLVSGNDDKKEEGQGTHKYFFQVNNKPTIPGTSLKGMLRSLVEAFSLSELAPINDRKQFWRNIDDHDYYMAKMGTANIKKEKDKVKQKAGYLVKTGADYEVYPVDFDAVAKDSPKNRHKKRVCSGNMQKKTIDYDFDLIDKAGQAIHVSDDVINDFFLQVTPAQESHVKKMYGLNLKRETSFTKEHPLPVFYLPVEDGKIDFLGIPRYFRYPARHTVAELRDKQMGIGGGKVDFAKRLFGYSRNENSVKGRISIEAASFAVNSPTLTTPSVVLGQPHETCVAHYLVQDVKTVRGMKSKEPRNDINSMMNYNKGSKLRGRKMYWHRDYTGNELLAPNQNDKVACILHPLTAGAKTQFTIHIHSLSLEELGAILEAISLPKGHAHKLGMGKALGFGSVRIDVLNFNVRADATKYGDLLTRVRDYTKGASFSSEQTRVLIDKAKNAFRVWLLQSLGKTNISEQEYENLEHIRALRKMLDFENRPKNEKTATMSLPLKEFVPLRILSYVLDV